MDDKRFDALARIVARNTGRRGVLKALAGAALGAIAGNRGDEALARTIRGFGDPCARNGDCATHFCGPDGTCGCHGGLEFCNGRCRVPCPESFIRADDCRCACPDGKERCGSLGCVDLQNDPANCGRCHHHCPSGCHNGQCCVASGESCNSTAECCSGVCNGGTCCSALGGACSATSDCCSGDQVTCGPGNTCCVPDGRGCDNSAQCCTRHCGGNGLCCHPNGQGCGADTDCCSGSCVNGTCCAGSGSCTLDRECCGGHCDQTSHTCCNPGGAACSAAGDCCGGGCSGGKCCSANSGSCTADGDCCSNFCIDGICCVPASGSCQSTGDCCAGTCQNGTCCFPIGGDCTATSDCCSGVCDDTGHCAAPTTTTTTSTTSTTTTPSPTTTTTTTPVCLPLGTQTRCNEFNQNACCSHMCAGGSYMACNQTVQWEGCCDPDGSSCAGAGFNPTCCGGFCSMAPGQTTGVCQSSALGGGQPCRNNIDCNSCSCTGGVCQ